MQVWNVLHAAHWKFRTQELAKKVAIWAPSYNFVGLYLRRHVSTIGKKIVKQQYLFHMSPQYGELRPTSGWDRSGRGTLTNFNGFRVLAALLDGTPAVGVSQTLRRWTQGATYIRQGDHHVGIGSHSSLVLNSWFVEISAVTFPRNLNYK